MARCDKVGKVGAEISIRKHPPDLHRAVDKARMATALTKWGSSEGHPG